MKTRQTAAQRRAALATRINEILAPHGLSLDDVLPPKRGLAQANGNDCINTDDDLALAVVRHFQPTGSILEPCSGGGAFLRAFDTYNAENSANGEVPLTRIESFEIKEGKDFLALPDSDPRRWRWLITNPPWSLLVAFLNKATPRVDNIVVLDKMNAFGFKARIRFLKERGWCIREYALFDQPPPPWPSMGLQLAAIHLSKARPGEELGQPRISALDWKPKKTPKLTPPP